MCLTEAVIREAEKCCKAHDIGSSLPQDADDSTVGSGSDDSSSEPPLKKQRSSLFASYSRRRTLIAATTSAGVTVRGAVLKYLELAEEQASSPAASSDPWLQLKAETTIQILQPLLEKVFFHSGNIRTSGAHLQPEWFDYAPQPGEAGEKTTQPACVSEM